MNLLGTRMQINGLNLNVPVEGEGEPVFLLHGFPDSNYLWLGVFRTCQRRVMGASHTKWGNRC